MADEMLGAVDDEPVAVLLRKGLHATEVGADAGFRQGEAVARFAADGGEKVLFALLGVAGHEDVGGPCHARPVQGVVGPSQFLLIKNPGQRIEPGAAYFGRHIGGVEPRFDGLLFQLVAEIVTEDARLFDLGFMCGRVR